jgi:hypothetical protein
MRSARPDHSTRPLGRGPDDPREIRTFPPNGLFFPKIHFLARISAKTGLTLQIVSGKRSTRRVDFLPVVQIRQNLDP